MTIGRGRSWGDPGGLPAGGVVVRDDAEARAVLDRARRAGDPLPALGLLGGDLCRTLGGTGDEARLRSADGMRLPVDLGLVLLDGRLHCFVAHLVARHAAWRGRAVAAMNAQYLGRWDVAPRAHPGDGLLDVLDARLGVGDRWKAWRRLPSGSHVPHPGIAESRVRAVQIDLDRATPIRLDGEPVGTARCLSLRLEPAAVVCVV